MILLDTSSLIDPPATWPGGVLGSSTLCLAELEFGLAAARSASEHATRTRNLAVYRATLEWIPFEASDAASFGVLAAKVASRRPSHARSTDIKIAAQAYTLGAALLTRNVRDFDLVSDLVEILDGNA